MKMLITGGSGFIGTNLVDFYTTLGMEVLNVDIKPPRNKSQSSFWQMVDIRDLESLKAIVAQFQPDYVLHMAARADLTGKSLDDYSTNISGVQNLIEACNQTKSIKKVIFASTMLVCRVGYIPKNDNDYCPPNLYGESKVIGEKLIREKSSNLDFDWLIIRPTSIWGPWFGPTYRNFFEMILKRRYFNFTGMMANKTYGFVENTVRQIDSLLNSDSANGRIFYLGDYIPTNIKEWSAEIAREIDYRIISVPRSVIWISAKVGDVLGLIHIKFPMNSFRYLNMTTDNIIPLDAIKEFAPLNFYTRIQGNLLTIKWMRDQYFNSKL